MLLTAAHILNDMKDELCGTVKLAFQPAEEAAIGAKSMIEQGALDGVDAAFGIHIWSDIDAGKVCCMDGPRMASADLFKIDIKGKGTHGAAPHQGVDAAVVTAAVINNLQAMTSRQTSPLDPLVVTVGTIETGTRWNVVAENSHMEGTTRCFSQEVWDAIPVLMERTVKNTAAALSLIHILSSALSKLLLKLKKLTCQLISTFGYLLNRDRARSRMLPLSFSEKARSWLRTSAKILRSAQY